jgi:flagellar protein FlaF
MSAAYLEAYRIAKNSTNMTGREIEAAALTRCALMLSECKNNWDAPNRDENLSEALEINQRVWTILQGELTREDNPLPKQIKEDLLSLSVFINKRTIQVMAYPSCEKLKILIDINLNIATGLNSSPDNTKEVEKNQNVVIPMPPQRLAQTSIRV